MSSEADTLLAAISRHPDRTLIIQGDRQFTPASLADAAGQLRAAYPKMASAGVALQCSNTSDLLASLVALDGYAPEILLLPPCLSGAALQRLLNCSGVNYLLSEGQLTTLAPAQESSKSNKETRWLFTTSGTTGTPKIFAHTLASLTVTVHPGRDASHQYRWGLAYQAHRFAGVQVVLQALISGNLLVIPPSDDTGESARSFAGHEVNTLSATPSQWRNFLSQGDIRQCPLTQITLGGEIADQSILSALAREFPAARIVHIYASTEAGVGFSVTDGKAGFPAAWLKQGPPRDLKISDSGSLLIKGPTLSCSRTLDSRLTEDGYLDTQDSVQVVDDRVLFMGRATGVINVGGNKVHPEEVENLVREMPGVRNAVASGRSSPIMGQLVLLEVQPEELSAEEPGALKRRIREHCRANLPKHKVPALINIVQELAVSESGKIERKQTG